MGKVESSIQKAIKKSQRSRASEKGLGSKVFEIFRTASTDNEIMEESRLVSKVDDRKAVAAYKIFRTRVLQRMRSNNWHSLIVTSTGAGDGKTLTALNLALSISRDVNQSVLLVDLDLQRSKVASYFGLETEAECGISDFLIGKAEIADIVYSLTEMPRFSVIPNFTMFENSSDMLLGPRMKELLAWIRQDLDQTIVIYDMPPVLVDDDVLAFSPEVDAVLLVVSQGLTNRVALGKTMHLLAENNILGVVLNRSDDSAGDNLYGYY